jgi:hypothetical protein
LRAIFSSGLFFMLRDETSNAFWRKPLEIRRKPEVVLFHPSGAFWAFWACFAINMPLLRSWIAIQGEGNPVLNTAHRTAVYMIVCPLI